MSCSTAAVPVVSGELLPTRLPTEVSVEVPVRAAPLRGGEDTDRLGLLRWGDGLLLRWGDTLLLRWGDEVCDAQPEGERWPC